MIRRATTFLLALALALGAVSGRSSAQTGPTEITLIHDTHVHGNFASGSTNIAQKAAVVKEIRSRRPSALFVGNGDDLATSILSGEFKGSHIVDAFNRMGLAADGIGNHEFDLGPDNFLARVKESQFTWVSANIRDKRTSDAFGAEVGVKKFTVVNVSGVKVGFTGLAPSDTPVVSSPGPNVQVLGYADAMREVLPLMRAAGADVTVVLSHICAEEAETLAAEVSGIDAILGDHCAGVLEQPKLVGNTIISRVGDEFRFVGELTLQVENGKVVGHSFTRHALTDKSPADPTMAALVKSYTDKLDANLGEVIGRTATPLDSMKANNRFRETTLGNFVSDVTRQIVSADVAITNGGNIRAEKVFQPGTLTKKDVIDSLPFPNYIMKIEVTGATLRAAMEHGVGLMEQGQGRFPQVSGISFRVNPTASAGQRVSDLRVAGQPIDPTRTYTLAVNSFLADGGDGYDMLKGSKVLVGANAGPLVATAVIEAIKKAGTIAPRTEGRILLTAGVSLEAGKASLSIAGRSQSIDVAPVVKDGVLHLPIRWVAELYGATVTWDGAKRATVVTMPWGSSVAIRDGVSGYIIQDRMMVPAFTLQQLGITTKITDTKINLSL